MRATLPGVSNELPDAPGIDPREYHEARALWIVERVAEGESLRALHLAHPDSVPSPMYVRRWARDRPQFGALLQEADASRAECLADLALIEAAHPKRKAANSRVVVQAHQWLSKRLDGERFGVRRPGSDDPSRPALNADSPGALTDGQLLMIAAGAAVGVAAMAAASARAAEGEREAIPGVATPHAPRAAIAPPAPAEVPGTDPFPKKIRENHSGPATDSHADPLETTTDHDAGG